MTQFLGTKLILPVSDIYDTTAWYEKVFGFETVYLHGEGRRGEAEDFCNYAIMARDNVEVHFMLDEGRHVWSQSGTAFLGLVVRDVDSLFAKVKALGIPIARGLQEENWPARGFGINDPSGNAIHIEQPDGN
jgi:uncharacterized glyoxalase superfamily protein PhnB